LEPLLNFSEIIEKRGVDPKGARLVRHNSEILAEYMAGNRYFLHAITYQDAGLDPYARAATTFHFIPGPKSPDGQFTALFVGAYSIRDSWKFGKGTRLATFHCSSERCFTPRAETLVYDINPMPEFEDLRERILIHWGNSTRSWSQWAANKRKDVIELRQSAREQVFPGFSQFSSCLEELPVLPPSWRGALSSVQGVYLLVCPKTGDQYVGSAYGETGFWGRWSAYVADGHGGNKLLKSRTKVNFQISILEVTSPDMAPQEIIARETAWKGKLGSKAHGLNAN